MRAGLSTPLQCMAALWGGLFLSPIWRHVTGARDALAPRNFQEKRSALAHGIHRPPPGPVRESAPARCKKRRLDSRLYSRTAFGVSPGIPSGFIRNFLNSLRKILVAQVLPEPISNGSGRTPEPPSAFHPVLPEPISDGSGRTPEPPSAFHPVLPEPISDGSGRRGTDKGASRWFVIPGEAKRRPGIQGFERNSF